MAPGTRTSTWGSGTSFRWGPPPQADDSPVLRGSGPPECSSSTAVSVRPEIIYDVNGYYRELGVHPRVTRKGLRLAYQAKDGQSSARLTYIMGQLLDPKVRYEYDCTPLGELFMDEYVRAALDRILKARMAERMSNLAKVGVDLDGVDDSALQRDIAAEMGFDIEDSDTPAETVDGPPKPVQDEHRPAKFEYAYYLWRTTLREDTYHLSRLAEWQCVLVRAFSREGVHIKFAVGFHGKPHRWVQALVGYRNVFFLNVLEDPTEELATSLARQVRLDQDRRAASSVAATLASTER